jgi:hypothetical protein
MKLPAAETDYWSGISWSEKTSILQLKSKTKIWNNANNWTTEKQKKKMLQAINQNPFKWIILLVMWDKVARNLADWREQMI